MGYEMGFLNVEPKDDTVFDDGWFLCGREYGPELFHTIRNTLNVEKIDEYTFRTTLSALNFLNTIYSKIYGNSDCVRYIETSAVDFELGGEWFSSLDVERRAAMASCFYYDGRECDISTVLWVLFEDSPSVVIGFFDELRKYYATNQTTPLDKYYVYFWESY